MDQHLLKQTADDMAQGITFFEFMYLCVYWLLFFFFVDCATVTQSLKLLRDAAAMLRNKISLHFKEAISVSDLESVKRFFKLFPLLNMHDYGLETFSSLLRKMVRFQG